MGKKVREYKSGDFIFAKVKGYPAWPARVQKLNGKKYFVYFYGTGETANLHPNMIFDYAENKDKFLTKTQKRRDFNAGVKQIEHDFANNVPLEEVIGVPTEDGTDALANDSVNDTMDATADTTTADDTANDTMNTTQNDAPEDSDENGALVIDEGKSAKKKKLEPKTPATPKGKEPKTPRGKAKKEEEKTEAEDEKKEEEIVSRSGRKIRPKRFVDEQTEDNSTLPSPTPKKKRTASPQNEKEKPEPKDKNIKSFNAVTQSELEELKQPFKPEDAEKENILIAYLPTGKYIGIKLFQSRPLRFKNEASRLQWDKLAASNAITLRMQLERGQISAMSVQGQLVMDLNLTDEEKTTLDNERETEEKKSRVQFLKTEMKLIELDARIKTCLSLEKADAELCLQMLDELNSLDVKPLMLLKHPTCVETVKRLRAYVGNTPSWDLTERAAQQFTKDAHRIRKQADNLYKHLKSLFTTPDGLTFWEYFSERVLLFKKVAEKLGASELLEMVHEPIEMTQPTSHTMNAAIDAANEEAQGEPPKKKSTPAKGKKIANNNSPVTKNKRQSSRKQPEAEDENKGTDETTEEAGKNAEQNAKSETIPPASTDDVENAEAPKEDVEPATTEKENEKAAQDNGKNDKSKEPKKGKAKEGKKSPRNVKNAKDAEKNTKETEISDKQADKNAKIAEKNAKIAEKNAKVAEKNADVAEKTAKLAEMNAEIAEKNTELAEKGVKEIVKIIKEIEQNSKEAEVTVKDTDKAAKESDEKEKDEAEKGEVLENSTEIVENSKDEESSSKDANDKEDEPSKDGESTNDDSPKDAEIAETRAKTPEKSPKKATKDKEAIESPTKVKKTESDDQIETEPKPDKEIKDKVTVQKEDKKRGDKNKDDKSKEPKEDKKDGEKGKESEKRKADDVKAKEDIEPRAKRSRDTRESKKTDAPPLRSPAKRKSKY